MKLYYCEVCNSKLYKDVSVILRLPADVTYVSNRTIGQYELIELGYYSMVIRCLECNDVKYETDHMVGNLIG